MCASNIKDAGIDLPLYPLRVGGFWVKQGYTRGDVHDVDRVQFRVGFLSYFHRSPGGHLGLT